MNNNYLSQISTDISSSISKQQDKLIFEALQENSAPIYNLTELMKCCKFIHQEGKNYKILNYNGRDILTIFDPEITCEDLKFKVEVKYNKLY